MKIMSENFLDKLQKGKLLVTYPDYTERLFIGRQKGYEANIKLNNYKIFSKLTRKAATGLAESYMDGDFETKDLSKLLLFSRDNESDFLKNKKNFIVDYCIKFKHFLNENTKKKSKKNIEYHYDLGNKFYEHWLDQSMTYSSAIFSPNNDNLYNAQINKYNQIAKPMNLSENSTLLEIGCGGGGFSTYIAKNYKSKVKAITISKEQYEYASQRVSKEGLNEKISIEMRDYRDINEKYSNIASIEMFEAVGKKYWITFLDKIKNSLLSEGVASLQIITINEIMADKYQSNPDFIQQYIFPGGVLPSKNQLNSN
jgi:cyclopropane-fatty-acyl-phospholipid synthase